MATRWCPRFQVRMPIHAMGAAAAQAMSTAGAPARAEYGKKVSSAAPTARIHAPR
jgi:hypothetical protein